MCGAACCSWGCLWQLGRNGSALLAICPLLSLLPAGTEQQEQSALERELAAGREAPKRETAAERERARKVEANLRHVLAAVSADTPPPGHQPTLAHWPCA